MSAGSASSETRVLAIWYSQTGQTSRAVAAVVAPLKRSGARVWCEEVRPVVDYPFPWTLARFFHVFPESVLGEAPAIHPLAVDPDDDFDLVVLGCQIWYLAPSLPVQGFLLSPSARVLRGKPVITVVTCRNMWYSAALRLQALIGAARGEFIGCVVLTDPGPPWATFVTTPRWFLTGRRDRFLRVFPPAGIDCGTFAALDEIGERVADVVLGAGKRSKLFECAGVDPIDPEIMLADLVGAKLFRPWARAIARRSDPGEARRSAWLTAFSAWLFATILASLPLVAVARALFPGLLRRVESSYRARVHAPLSAPSPRSRERWSGGFEGSGRPCRNVRVRAT